MYSPPVAPQLRELVTVQSKVGRPQGLAEVGLAKVASAKIGHDHTDADDESPLVSVTEAVLVMGPLMCSQ